METDSQTGEHRWSLEVRGRHWRPFNWHYGNSRLNKTLPVALRGQATLILMGKRETKKINNQKCS